MGRDNQPHILLPHFFLLLGAFLAGCGSDPTEPSQPPAPAEHWTKVETGTTEQLWAVSFAQSSPVGFIAGLNGTVLKSIDQGATWKAQASQINDHLLGVYCLDSLTAIAVGGDGDHVTIIGTRDGGENWNAHLRQVAGRTTFLRDVHFWNRDSGIVVGDFGTVMMTDDAGTTWTTVSSGTQEHFRSAAFLDRQRGTAVGINGLIAQTEDGGHTWQIRPLGTTPWLYDVAYASDSTLVAAWTVGRMLRTDDGGFNWTTVLTQSPYDNLAIQFIDDRRAVTVGGNRILGSSDVGRTWDRQSAVSVPGFGLLDLHFFDADVGVLVGHGGTVLRTVSGGGLK